MRRHTLHCLSLFLPLILAACENYDIKVNETRVYTPPALFRDYAVTDPALQQCLQQAISDNRVSEAGNLQNLNCSHAGIRSLEGLGVFTGITRLKLSSNTIRNLMELSAMTALRTLQLDDNRVVDPVPLFGLRELRELDLSGNTTLQCPDTDSFPQVTSLALPEHCPPTAANLPGSPAIKPPHR